MQFYEYVGLQTRGQAMQIITKIKKWIFIARYIGKASV